MLFTVVIVMMFIGQVPNDLMFKGLAVIVGVGAFFVLMVMAVPEDTWNSLPGCKRVVTVKHRIERKFNIGNAKDRKKTGKSETDILLNDENSQTTYASIAIANSDVIGLGPGNSIQRDFLQHAESDFIYAIIVEEMGIVGAFFVAFLYLALLIRVGRIAQKCTSFFPAYLVLGFGVMMVMQAFVNMSVAVGLVPVTGQTLPLISKGGTSILITSFYIGVILSVSRYAEKKEMKAPLVEAVPEGETSEYYTDGAMS
jgi:cell division protein FtsW